MAKVFQDQIPPAGGRKYQISANADGSSNITDITQYQQDGTPLTAEFLNGLQDGTYPVGKADKLTTARKIGSADFDGSGDITLAQMGAAASALNIVSLSNSFAEYGTNLQMEWGAIELQNIEVINPSGGVFTANVSSLIFRSPFAEPPVLLTSWDSSGTYVGVAATEVSSTGIGHFTIYRGTSSTVSGRINYLAIGQKGSGVTK